MNQLYANEVRLLMNYFQPSVKLIEKRRLGSRIQRRYDSPMTPLDRLIAHQLIDAEQAARLLEHRRILDPFELAAAIERKVSALEALPAAPTAKRSRHGPRLTNLSKKATAIDAALERAPVRSFLARRSAPG